MAAENIRQAMLKQMGLTPWFPRMPLPGAAASHNYDFDPVTLVEDMSETVEPLPSTLKPPALKPSPPKPSILASPEPVSPRPAQPSPVLPLSAGLSARNLPGVESTSEKDLPADPVTAVPVAADLADEPVPAFAFSWFSIDKRLAVLAMLPEREAAISRPCRQMLTRILAALSSDYQQVTLEEHSFHWPFPDDLGLPSGSLAARQAVDGFVARRLRDRPAAMLLVLADGTPPFLFKAGATDSEAGILSVHRQFGFAMLRTHSLHSMDRNPELKRSAWQAMKVLLERLNRKTE